MSVSADEFVVDFPTLGHLGADWIEWHCPIPDGFRQGDPYVMADWQLWCTLNHYRVKPGVEYNPDNPILGPAFHNRRSLVIAPQKTGKGPWSAAGAALEARGPVVFAGWARGDETYECRDHGCGCGFVYYYEPGEPMGIPHPTPLIQIMATSEDQVDNIWRPLSAMVKNGPLSESMKPGEEFIRLPNNGRIDKITSNANSRLGNPITAAFQDENGLYTRSNRLTKTARTMRRGLAGMGGRSIATSNAWDPSERSDAQETFELQQADVFHFFRQPPKAWKFKLKGDRLKILKYVYEGSWWVNLDAIEAEAAELMLLDPAEAERFYGNRLVQGQGTWLDEKLWEATYAGNGLAAESAAEDTDMPGF
jgi:hypothetical protein